MMPTFDLPQEQARMEDRLTQTTSHLLMIRPVRFGFNEQTAEDNAFMHNEGEHSPAEIRRLAQEEFDLFVEMLRQAGITVSVFEDTPEPHTPDSIFPNNWISFHEHGKIIIYPMHAPNRRDERRGDIVAHFQAMYQHPPQVIDLSFYEQEGKFLESTGSMVMDRVHQKVYACHSPRTTPELFERFCEEVSAEGFLFHAVDAQGIDIYHTNVMMAIGTRFAVVCLAAIHDLSEREELVRRLSQTGHEVVPITYEQMNQFAGNMLQLYNYEGQPVLVMSRRAYKSLRPDQIATLQGYTELLVIPLDVIETYGGGSVRCMMAEVFLDGLG